MEINSDLDNDGEIIFVGLSRDPLFSYNKYRVSKIWNNGTNVLSQPTVKFVTQSHNKIIRIRKNK